MLLLSYLDQSKMKDHMEAIRNLKQASDAASLLEEPPLQSRGGCNSWDKVRETPKTLANELTCMFEQAIKCIKKYECLRDSSKGCN